MTTFRYVMSLGSHCYAAWLLKEMGLRQFSGPFDWLFGDPGLVTACIADDCQTLLATEHLREMEPKGGTRYGHALYSERFHRPVIFNHHNPLSSEHAADLRRAAARLRFVLQSTEAKLFWMVAPPERATPAAIAALDRELGRQTSNYKLLVATVSIAAPGLLQEPQLTLSKHGDCYEVYHLDATSPHRAGLSFENDADNGALRSLLLAHEFDLAGLDQATA